MLLLLIRNYKDLINGTYVCVDAYGAVNCILSWRIFHLHHGFPDALKMAQGVLWNQTFN